MLVSVVSAIEIPWPSNVPSGASFHQTLYTDEIKPANGTVINIAGVIYGNGSGIYGLDLGTVFGDAINYEGNTVLIENLNVSGNITVNNTLRVLSTIYSPSIISEYITSDNISSTFINTTNLISEELSTTNLYSTHVTTNSIYGGEYCDATGTNCTTIEQLIVGGAVDDIWVDTTGDTMTGALRINQNAGALNLRGTNHVYIQFYPDNDTRRAWIGYGSSGSEILTIHNNYSAGTVRINSGLDVVGGAEIGGDLNVSGDIECTECIDSVDIATGAVGTNEVADNSLTASDLAANSVGASEIAANAVGTIEIAANAVGTSEIAANAVTNAKIHSMNWNKLGDYPDDCSSGQVMQGVGDTLTCVEDESGLTEAEADNLYVNVGGDTMTGDLTVEGNIYLSKSMDQIRFTSGTDDWWWMSKAAPTSNLAFAVYSPTSDGGSHSGFKFRVKENGDAIVSGDLTVSGDIGCTGCIDSVDIATDAVGTDEIADNSLTASDLAANSVGASEVADNSLTASDLAANSVGASEIASGAVGASEIASGAVGT
ncbi:hypothetical protein ISS04_01790, partial [Candidatus Woesearchaeota archaeon]|nr:hypothetical protein [Candidatus Woesearchaeota archaeon]